EANLLFQGVSSSHRLSFPRVVWPSQMYPRRKRSLLQLQFATAAHDLAGRETHEHPGIKSGKLFYWGYLQQSVPKVVGKFGCDRLCAIQNAPSDLVIPAVFHKPALGSRGWL